MGETTIEQLDAQIEKLKERGGFWPRRRSEGGAGSTHAARFS